MTTRSVQPLLHRSRQKVPPLYTWLQSIPIIYNGRLFPPKLPLPMGDLDAHLTHDSFGPYEPTTQTASRSVQPFLHRWPQSVPILYNGMPLSIIKIAPCHGEIWTPSNTRFPRPTQVLNPNGILIGLAVFAGLTIVIDRPTDQQTTLLGQ